VIARFHGVRQRADPGVCPPPDLGRAVLYVAVTTVAALDEVPEDLRLCARTLGASPRYTMLRVQIRAALPGILTGMRIAMAGAWTSIVAAELIAATSGLGYLIVQAGDYLNTALVFSGIIMIAILGLAWTPACAACSCWPTRAGGAEGSL
jgi:ABC-type nitrate/sulfonate/bicarbonate transport system permease component